MNWTELSDFLQDTAQRLRIPACFCTVTQAHRPLFSGSAGADAATLAQSRDASFWIYSATKPICAAAAMQMVEAGIFRPDEPVSRYLPAFASLSVQEQQGPARSASTPLLIEHLLSMQGGFDYELHPPAVQCLLRQKHGIADTCGIAAAFAEKPLQFDPGSHFQYSLCLDVLGAVMEAASGIRLGRWMREKLFLPLGMTHTGFSVNDKLPPLAPQFRQLPDGSIIPAEPTCFCRLTPLYESGGGGLCSTMEDYALFADAMACGGIGSSGAQILSPRLIDRMRENRLTGASLADFRRRYTRPGYGYGFGVRTSLGDGTAQPRGVFGWDGAAGAHVMIDPSRELSLVYFQQVLDMEILYDHVFDKLDAIIYRCLEQPDSSPPRA